jgi:sodium-independent sulfate anion transporter 11
MPDDITKSVGNGLSKALGIKRPYRDALGAHADPVARGESTFSVGTADTVSYLEPEPTTGEWFREHAPSVRDVVMYFLDILPFWRWITWYNWQWFLGDLVAGMSFDGHF